jgi:tRNA-2-methylthio-N6-dimethylallyladenosine synthase
LDPKHYYLWNIGCQMNRADAYRVGEALEKRGYRPTRQPEQADVLVLNTCVVRQSAEDKVLGRMNSLSALKRRPGSRALLVMGCFVDDPDALSLRYPHVDAFFKPSDIAGVEAFVAQWEAQRDAQASTTAVITPAQVTDLVPISYGCDHHCTYCVVTLRRGAQRSRTVGEIVSDVERLVARGTREITLLGQNVDAYGSDLPDHPDLADILRAIHDLDGLWRIRFLTSHPKDMTQRIIDTVAALPKVCETWELPVQAGDDDVLRRMARGYSVAHFEDLVRRIRQANPQSATNTDVIVGFPGETDAQFARTLALVRATRFDAVHVAAYSPRPDTVAARWEDDVTPQEKERRRAAIEQAQAEVASELNATLMGQEVEVLVDGQQRGRWRGRTRTNKLIFFPSTEDWLGQLARVHITWTGPWSMLGEVVSVRAPRRGPER